MVPEKLGRSSQIQNLFLKVDLKGFGNGPNADYVSCLLLWPCFSSTKGRGRGL